VANHLAEAVVMRSNMRSEYIFRMEKQLLFDEAEKARKWKFIIRWIFALSFLESAGNPLC
jgi:hypothetical protein